MIAIIRRHGSPPRCHRALREHRAATSLVEVVVVMTVASIIIGLCGTLIHRLLAAEHEASRVARFAVSVTRLSRAFRSDLHAARDVQIVDSDDSGPAALVATLGDRHIVRYELDGHLATRTETERESQIHYDVFHFAPGSRLRFDRSPDEKLVTLEMNVAAHVPGAGPERPGRILAVDVALARDHRFDATPQQEVQAP